MEAVSVVFTRLPNQDTFFMPLKQVLLYTAWLLKI